VSTVGHPHELVVADESVEASGSIAGPLASWTERTWHDFERASRLAQVDLDQS
jgi:hypothetical protein